MNNQNDKPLIYLDNASTTRVSESAIQKAVDLMKYNFANPSSAHSMGLFAEKEVTLARKRITEALGFERTDGELYFTAGGTEANNLALFGVAEARKHSGKKILVADGEHASVHNSVKQLEERGYEVVYISTKGGKLDLSQLENEADENCIIISCMLVNNETGALYDLGAVNEIRKRKCPGAYIHTDAVQGFCKEDVSFKTLGADLVSVSGHKLHAPKGVGALYVRKGVKIKQLLYGGGQEKNMRSGTEAVPAICAFGLCTELLHQNIKENHEKIQRLYEYLEEKLKEHCGDVKINKPEKNSPYIMSIVIPNIRSEIFMHFLSDKGIYVSAGSACSSRNADNRVLSAFGLKMNDADSTIRISFCDENTTEDADSLIQAIIEGKQRLMPTKFFKKESD